MKAWALLAVFLWFVQGPLVVFDQTADGTVRRRVIPHSQVYDFEKAGPEPRERSRRKLLELRRRTVVQDDNAEE